MAPFERAMVVSYRLSIVTVALSVTIRLQFAIECLRHSLYTDLLLAADAAKSGVSSISSGASILRGGGR